MENEDDFFKIQELNPLPETSKEELKNQIAKPEKLRTYENKLIRQQKDLIQKTKRKAARSAKKKKLRQEKHKAKVEFLSKMSLEERKEFIQNEKNQEKLLIVSCGKKYRK